MLQSVRSFSRKLSSQADEPMTEAITAPTVVEARTAAMALLLRIGAAVAPGRSGGSPCHLDEEANEDVEADQQDQDMWRSAPATHDPDTACAQGWVEVDSGGAGDCFFRSMAVHDQACHADATGPDKAKYSGGSSRDHMPCRDRFQALFKGKSPFEDCLRDVAKITTWAEGAIIQATAEKLGVPIAVWHYAPCLDNPEINEWSRYVLATRFSKGYACCARGKQAAVVILRDRQYTAVLPPKDTPVPMSWTKETPTFVIDLQEPKSWH